MHISNSSEKVIECDSEDFSSSDNVSEVSSPEYCYTPMKVTGNTELLCYKTKSFYVSNYTIKCILEQINATSLAFHTKLCGEISSYKY